MQVVTVMVERQVIVATPKTFRTGSRGYFGQGKVYLDGRKYQAQVQLVEVGSKQQQ